VGESSKTAAFPLLHCLRYKPAQFATRHNTGHRWLRDFWITGGIVGRSEDLAFDHCEQLTCFNWIEEYLSLIESTSPCRCLPAGLPSRSTFATTGFAFLATKPFDPGFAPLHLVRRSEPAPSEVEREPNDLVGKFTVFVYEKHVAGFGRQLLFDREVPVPGNRLVEVRDHAP
jgi:hypothetical protein